MASASQNRELTDGRAWTEEARDLLLPVAPDDDTKPSGDDQEHAVGRVTLMEEPLLSG